MREDRFSPLKRPMEKLFRLPAFARSMRRSQRGRN